MTQTTTPTSVRPRRRKRGLLIVLAILILGLVGVNVIAYMQAWAMTHFIEAGSRTAPPESLGLAQKVEVLFTGVRVPKPMNRTNPADAGLAFRTVRFAKAGTSPAQARKDCASRFTRTPHANLRCWVRRRLFMIWDMTC